VLFAALKVVAIGSSSLSELVVTLPPDIVADMRRIAEAHGQSADEIVREASGTWQSPEIAT
jgi:hypothetical protein